MTFNRNKPALMGKARGIGAFDAKLGRRRTEWLALDKKAKLRKYQQAIRGFNAGLPGEKPGTFRQYSIKQAKLDQGDSVSRSRNIASHTKELPPPALFGSSARTEMLALLAHHGPLTVREIARLRGVDSSATFRAIESLLKSAIIVKRDRAGGRKFIALNRSHPAYDKLVALMRAIAEYAGFQEFPQARYRHGLPLARSRPPDADAAPALGSPVRAKILVMLALATEADPTQLARLTGHNRLSVYYACNALHEREKILRRRTQGVRAIYGLATDYPGATLYIEYLKAIAKTCDDNVAIANLIVGITSRWF